MHLDFFSLPVQFESVCSDLSTSRPTKMKTVKWELPTMSFTKILHNLSKLFYKIIMSFAEFLHKLVGLDKSLKAGKHRWIFSSFLDASSKHF